MPAPNPVAKESAQDFMARVAQINTSQCPACERGRLHVVQTCQGQKRLPDLLAARPRLPPCSSKAERLRREGRERDDDEDANHPAKQSMARAQARGGCGTKLRG